VQLPSPRWPVRSACVVGWLYLPTRASGPIFDFGPERINQNLRHRGRAGIPRGSRG
jgi:hypothetical protein